MVNINDVVLGGDFLVLDTETTGLKSLDEIIEIAVIDAFGKPLLNTRVKPTRRIPLDATEIHHISDEDVKDAAAWSQVSEELMGILQGRRLIIYNVDYDTRLLTQTDRAHGLTRFDWRDRTTVAKSMHCAMEAFAPLYGDWSHYHHSYTFKGLAVAAECYQIPAQAAPPHSALGDCLMTLEVCRAMAAKKLLKKPRLSRR